MRYVVSVCMWKYMICAYKQYLYMCIQSGVCVCVCVCELCICECVCVFGVCVWGVYMYSVCVFV